MCAAHDKRKAGGTVFTKGAVNFIVMFSWGIHVDFKKATLQCEEVGVSYAQQKETVCQQSCG